MAKKVYAVKVHQGSNDIEIYKDYNEYEYALVSELFGYINFQLNDETDLRLSIEETDKTHYSIDYETEGITTIKNEITGAIEHTIDNMSPQECIDLFKATLDSHIKVNSSFDDEENNDMIDFSDVISSRLVNQTSPSHGLKLGNL